jgi:hypothetical protein
MRVTAVLLVVSLGSCTVPPGPAYAPRPAAELVGLVAGSPQRCIPIRQNSSMHVDATDRGTLIYRADSTVWANHVAPCSFSSNDVLVLEPTGSSYCEGDIVRSFKPAGGIQGPSCVLGPFVPYRR